jgi:hypothetical protein
VVLLLISNVVMLYLLMQSKRQEEELTQQRGGEGAPATARRTCPHAGAHMLSQLRHVSTETENEQLRVELDVPEAADRRTCIEQVKKRQLQPGQSPEGRRATLAHDHEGLRGAPSTR